ncbi:Gfo/Idh/MocA family protein [Pseudogracilibacillus auburnensis]|uniref:Gfo/Idh/MocA family protein n=1 Tax=Pseudogracilibacillus auburnensis TaxID=1494959 RepID=UPI001A96D975|nr:Gfo/Idh/MocA family oxidoreductase [Pseudogracilibacillus auburnensis]MBO1005333.1 Gfo/Idh/MocA family oxidoreductase [Pseudogracilibacillus auburnensis]
MRKIRIGIIGVGLIGKSHLHNYSSIPGAEIVAVCDINGEEAQRVAEKYDIPHVYTDFRELLKRDDIEAVDVCLHNNFHAPVTIAALEADKHVYCEKPIAGTYFDGKRMVDAANETGKHLHIQLATLYKKETKAAKTLIEEGKLGKIYHARSNGFRRRGRPFVDGYGTKAFTRKDTATGGALIDMGVYHIAQMLYLLDLPTPTRISGKVYQEMEMDPIRRQESGFDVEELALGFVKFEKGITLDIMEAWSVHLGGMEGSSIIGSLGGLRLPDFQKGGELTYHTTVCDIDMDSKFNLDAADYRWHTLRENADAYDSSQHHWIAALQGRVDLLPTAEIALKTMLISEGIYLSDARGEEVAVDELIEKSQSTSVLM